MPDEEKRVKPFDDEADWVMSFVDHSREKREPFEQIWQETEENFLVRFPGDTALSTEFPLYDGYQTRYGNQPGYSRLKDPETHQEVMTIVAKIVLGLFPEPGFAKAKRVGFEDIFKAKTVSELIEYVSRLPTHFITVIEWLMGATYQGTGLIEAGWEYREAPREFRRVEVDDFGAEQSFTEILIAPEYDDALWSPLDVRDFFPDPSQTRMAHMLGAAKRFKVTAAAARRNALYKQSAVENAIDRRTSEDMDEAKDKPSGDDTSGSAPREAHESFLEMTGYEYFGLVPYKTRDGFERRVVTVISGETVRSDPWPRRLPFFDCKITPRKGSFWGIAPAEIIRHDQDFADVLKMMLADAVVRMTHPAPIVDRNAGINLAKLKRHSPDVPIESDNVNGVNYLDYDPQLGPAFQMYAGVKSQMREGSGALGAIQGLGLGSKRFSATEAATSFQQALDRPELFATVVEREYLPPLAKYTLELYQTFLQDTEDLLKRVGESNGSAVLADILPDFDIHFVGTRMLGTQQQKNDAFREISAAAASNPIILQATPWIPLLRKWFDGIGASEIAAMVGNPQLMQLHVMLTQLAGPQGLSGNGNGEAPANAPSALLPAQVSGEAQV